MFSLEVIFQNLRTVGDFSDDVLQHKDKRESLEAKVLRDVPDLQPERSRAEAYIWFS